MMSLLSPLLPRGPVNLSARLGELPNEGADLPQMPEWRLVETPGHTPGHVSFWREKDATLLPGDAFCTTKPESFFEASMAQHPELHGPPAYFTSDWAMASRSVRRLAGLDPAVVAPGHGKPLAGAGVAEALRKLARDFERIAVPENQKVTV
jgi:glyoxylase-like metal-dependent hydrolase (beta-lactamase superfamily II)